MRFGRAETGAVDLSIRNAYLRRPGIVGTPQPHFMSSDAYHAVCGMGFAIADLPIILSLEFVKEWEGWDELVGLTPGSVLEARQESVCIRLAKLILSLIHI